MTRVFWLILLAFPLAAFDAATEVAQLRDAMNRAYAAKDTDALAKCLTADYFAVTHAGTIRDVKTTVDAIGNTPPPSWNMQILKTSVYGDTVIELVRERWTDKGGSKREVYAINVYVKQFGVWKQASRSTTDSAAK